MLPQFSQVTCRRRSDYRGRHILNEEVVKPLGFSAIIGNQNPGLCLRKHRAAPGPAQHLDQRSTWTSAAPGPAQYLHKRHVSLSRLGRQ